MPDHSTDRTNLSHLRHDLRTPINQIIGYSELLMEETEDAGHDAYAPDLTKINQAAKTLLNLINDNLTDARLSLTGDVSAPTAATQAPFAFTKATPSDLVPIAPSSDSTPPAPVTDVNELLAHASDTFDTNRPAPAPGRILIVDDNEGNRDMLARQLARQGHLTATAENGQVALDLLRAEPFDLVLLDMMMPVLDGYGTLVAIKDDPALRHLPVIMVSALDELGAVVRCIERGAEDFLPKPFNPTLLRARIGAGLEKKRFRDQEARYVATIEETQKRLQAELTEAEHYVRSILPAPLTEGPVLADWRFTSSTELGGDSLGYHWIDSDHFACYLLDVCGHGVGAALLSVAAINTLRNGTLSGVDFRDPGAVLTSLNDAFQMEKQNNMYFTIWYGVWRVSTRTLRYATAGHPPALLLPAASGATLAPLKATGMVLGGMEGITYKTFERAIPDPATLYVVSDGTFEIKLQDDTMWSEEAFQEFLAHSAATSSRELDALYEHVTTLHGPGPLDDDFSILRLSL